MNDAQIYLLKLFLISLFTITGSFTALILIFYYTSQPSYESSQPPIDSMPFNDTES